MRRGNEPAWKHRLRELQSGPLPDAWGAAKNLANCRSRNCADALVLLLHRHDCPERSEIAAHALSWMLYRSPITALAACLCDVTQHATVRGQAAEGLGLHFLCTSRRTRARSKAEAALLHGLSDSSATVRFWCCYALGTLRSTRSIPQLEHLRDHDSAFAPGWWYVHEEASDALEWIEGTGTPNERVPVHLRHAEAETAATK